MNKKIQKLLDTGTIIGGKMTKQDGFVIFSRKEKIDKVNEEEMAFATKSMGRGIFAFDSDGKVINYKGVDSHFFNEELIALSLVSGEAIYIPNPGESYIDSLYPLNLIVFPGNRPEIRLRGTSPLEDLEEEAEINAKMQGNGIKLPRIARVKEFTQEFSKKNNLPMKIDGSFDEFTSNYTEENSGRKSFLKEQYGEYYEEEIIEGKRPEKLSEYIRRRNLSYSKEITDFLSRNNLTLEDFISAIDKAYSLGQRYGQTERILQNPFRMADLEYYTKVKNLSAIEAIVDFSESLQENPKEPMENYFAKQMGKNLGNMLNSGWMCTNFAHRQDYSLAGEMCDDSYQYLPYELEKAGQYEKGKAAAISNEKKRKFFYQIYALGSNIKVLQDEMRLRGKSTFEIETVLSDFVSSFTNTLDLEKVSNHIGTDAKKTFEQLLKPYQDYEKILAAKIKKPGEDLEYDKETLEGQKGNNAFFEALNSRIALKLDIKRNFCKNIETGTENRINEQSEGPDIK